MECLQDVLVNIINMSVTASIIIVFVLLARLLLKRCPKIFSYVLWAVVLFRLLCPVSITTNFSLLGLFDFRATEEAEHVTSLTVVSQEAADTYLPERVNQMFTKLPEQQEMMPGEITENVTGTVTDSNGKEKEPIINITWNPLLTVTVIWLIGMEGILVYSIALLLRMKRNLVGAVHLKDNIFLADYIDSPFVKGLIQPRIYLPSGLSVKEQEYIILHEKHHIRRGDHIIKWLSFLALGIHWFNPLVWVAFVASGKDMEMSCDEAVVKKLGGEICQEYSASLLSLATGRRIIAGTPLAFGEGNTKSRIKNVLKWRKPKVWISALTVVFCLVAVAWCLGNPKADVKANNAGNTVTDEQQAEGNKEGNNQTEENKTGNLPDNTSDIRQEASKDDEPKQEQEQSYFDSVPPRVPEQGEYGSVEDVAFYLELASSGKRFQNMSTEKMQTILEEYDGLLENYELFARESTDGKTAYIVGAYSEFLENSIFYTYSMEIGIGEDEPVQILYNSEDSEAVDAAIAEGKYPEAGNIIKNSRIYFSSDDNVILIQPTETELNFDTVFNRYLYTPNGRAYMIDAASRGIALTGCEEPYLSVYMISEKYGEIVENIPLTEEEVADIEKSLAENSWKIFTGGFGFGASLYMNGESMSFNESQGVPQPILDLAMERCGYQFASPKSITASITEARFDCSWLEEPLYLDEAYLSRLEEILKGAKMTGVGNCGYGAKLTITMENGETLVIFKGTDDCGSLVFGSYGGYSISDEADGEFWEMFGLSADAPHTSLISQEEMIAELPYNEVPVNSLGNVTMIMEKYKSYEGDIEIVNQTGSDISTGEWYSLQRYEDGEWHRLDELIDGIWKEVEYYIPSGETAVFPTNWKTWFGELPPGEYRIVKEVYVHSEESIDTYYLATVFKINE